MLDSGKILMYIDDLLETVTEEENLQILNELYKLVTDNLKEFEKYFLKRKIDYLNYTTINKQRISPNSENVDAVTVFYSLKL